MSERALNKLFLRYRRKGDAAALGEVFDRTAPELLKLAMHLVRDPTEAEDVLQATFVAAIEARDAFDASRPLLPWLTGILARQAGLARRRARRVVEEDRLTPRASEDPAQRAELQEFSAELVLALQALPDNYREVLWMHLADGKRPVEIAQSLQRAPGTVRMQVHRGLDLLRRALPAGYAAGVLGLGATRGLAAIRIDVLAHAAAKAGAPVEPGPAGAAASSAPSTTAWLLGLCAAAALSTAAWWWRGGGAPSESAALAPPPASADEVAGALDPGRAADETGRTALAPPAAESTPAAQLATVLLRGRVGGLAPSECADTRLTVRGIARFQLPPDLAVTGAPSADGSFELDVSPLVRAGRAQRPVEELVLTVDHPRCAREEVRVPTLFGATVEVHEGNERRVYTADVALDRAAAVSGRARCDSLPAGVLPCALLFALEGGRPLPPAADRAPCAEDGTFHLRARQAGDHAVVIVAEGLRPATAVVALTPGFAAELGTLDLDAGARVAGQAFHMGLPMRRAGLVSATTEATGAWCAFEGARFLWTGARFERGGGIAETDADGRFEISGLAPGAHRLAVARAAEEGAPAGQRRLLLSTARGTPVEAPAEGVELRAEFAVLHVQLQARGEDGAHAARAAKVSVRQGPNATEFPLRFGETGTLSVEPGLACRFHVEVEGFLGLDQQALPPAAGAEDTLALVLARDETLAALELQLLERGLPLAAEVVALRFTPLGDRVRPAREFVRNATGAQGRFRVEDLPAGDWSVSAYAGGVWEHYRDLWRESRRDVHLASGATASAEFELARGGRLEVSAVNPAGALVPAACTIRPLGGEPLAVDFLGRGSERTARSARHLSELGPSTVQPNLPPGTYEVALEAPGYAPALEVVRIEAGAVARLRAALAAGSGGR